MTAKKGNGLLMVYSDVAAEHDEEYKRWYNEEHIPERLSIPGVLNAARYEAVRGGPRYLACYELESVDAWYSEAWQKWLKEPTEWSKRMSPSVIGTAYIRNLYTRIYPDHVPEETAQADMSPVILVGRMSVPEELEEKFNKAYNTERLPEATKIPGYIRARRWEAVMGATEYSTVHEMESMDVVNGDGWKAWSPMVTPVWNTEMRPHMVHEEGSPGYSAGFSRNDRRLNAIPSSFKGRGLSSSGDAYFTALTHAY